MGEGYQKRDHEIIDYELWRIDGIGRPLRGPPQDLRGGFVTALGAAQTFGCYAERPYPALLGEALRTPVLNFGVAGAGPAFFTSRGAFLRHVNRGRSAIVQLMSARSVSNRLFESRGGEMLVRRSDGVTLGAAPMYRELLASRDYRLISDVLHETRHRWVVETADLLDRIEVPTTLLWFSVRAPGYAARLDDVHAFFGDFPQLVNREMVDLVRPFADCYVEVVTADGLPQTLRSRFTGEPVSIEKRADLGGATKAANDYYPSPEMHRVAAAALLEDAGELLRG